MNIRTTNQELAVKKFKKQCMDLFKKKCADNQGINHLEICDPEMGRRPLTADDVASFKRVA